MVYIVRVFTGCYDDCWWHIHSIWDCPIKADAAKRKKEAEISELKTLPEPKMNEEDEPENIEEWSAWFNLTNDALSTTKVDVQELSINKIV